MFITKTINESVEQFDLIDSICESYEDLIQINDALAHLDIKEQELIHTESVELDTFREDAMEKAKEMLNDFITKLKVKYHQFLKWINSQIIKLFNMQIDKYLSKNKDKLDKALAWYKSTGKTPVGKANKASRFLHKAVVNNGTVVSLTDFIEKSAKEFNDILDNLSHQSFSSNNHEEDHEKIMQTDTVKLFKEKVEKVKFALLGDFNLYNTLGAVAIARKIGISWEDILKRVSNIKAAPGRFEALNCGQDYKVIVDYAHTPDALVNVIVAARNIRNGNRIITIFGCGGDRDRTKRPIMAKAAENLSDIVILTSDNPRTESPEQIFADVKTGFTKNDDYFFEPDREKAIKLAINMAEKNDIILITGKGHETYHIIGTKKWHFDDKEIARREIVRRRMVENVN